MQSTSIPNKTPAGRAEVSARKVRLNARQRIVLISINGTETMQEMREHFRLLGDIDTLVTELCTAGLVAVNGPAELGLVNGVAPAKKSPASTADESMHRIPPIGLVRQFMNETTVAAVGLRAFLFTLKLERCDTKADLLDLLPEYQRVLGKGKDKDLAEVMTRRAQDMLDKL